MIRRFNTDNYSLRSSIIQVIRTSGRCFYIGNNKSYDYFFNPMKCLAAEIFPLVLLCPPLRLGHHQVDEDRPEETHAWEKEVANVFPKAFSVIG